MKIYFLSIFALVISLLVNPNQTFASSEVSTQLAQSNLWNPNFIPGQGKSNRFQGNNQNNNRGNRNQLWNPNFKQGKRNNNATQRNNRNTNQGQQNQMWNPDFHKNELQRHNDMDERQRIRQQVYDGIFKSPQGAK